MPLAANPKSSRFYAHRRFRLAAVCVAVAVVVLLSGIANYYSGQAAFDFRVSNSGSNSNAGGITVHQGGSGAIIVTVFLVKGSAQAVTLSCGRANGPLPTGVSCNFTPSSSYPPFNATLTLTTSPATPRGYYTIEAMGTAGGLTRVTLFSLIVT